MNYIKYVGKQVNYTKIHYSDNEFQYNVYANKVEEKDYYGKQPAIATLLERDYNNAVLTKEKYELFRQKHKEQLMNNASALKIAIAEHLQNIRKQIQKLN